MDDERVLIPNISRAPKGYTLDNLRELYGGGSMMLVKIIVKIAGSLDHQEMEDIWDICLEISLVYDHCTRIARFEQMIHSCCSIRFSKEQDPAS